MKWLKKHILVEVPLTSNAYILNIYNAHHPFLLYLQHHVPVALCTDDEGILRTDLTREFKRAILSYHLSYSTLKRLVRNSLNYSFLSGKNLWENKDQFIAVKACRRGQENSPHLSQACKDFLNHNQKANLQWKLENQFLLFEKK